MGRRLIFSLTITPAALAAVLLIFQISRTPDFSTVKSHYKASDRAILDRRGRLIDEVHFDKTIRHLNWVDLNRLPRFFIDSVLTAQDRRFYFHPGFDPLAFFRQWTDENEHPADTLSMQLVTMIEGPSRHSVFIRIGQALALELKWRKREILEAYINLVPYRKDLHGLSAASFSLFDKNPIALTKPEAAVLAALIGSPNVSLTLMHDRACHLLHRLNAPEECGLLSPSHLSYLDEIYRIHPFTHMAPIVAQRLAKDSELHERSLIRSTLDRDLQWKVIHSLQEFSLRSAAIVIENASGNVIADVEESEPPLAGAILKPLLFAKALDERVLTAATELENSPKHFVTARTALSQNLNLPTMHVLDLLGADTFIENLKALGVSDLQTPDHYGPSLALGAVSINLHELANAYRAVANRGLWSPLRFSPELSLDETARRVYSEATAFIISDILATHDGSRSWTALKLEKSEDGRDHIAVGFSEKYTVAIWIHREASATASDPARAVWSELIKHLHSHELAPAPEIPTELTEAPTPGLRHKEWFISGTEPTQENAAILPTHIAYPLNQSSIALNRSRARPHSVFIQIVAPKSDQNLYLNGRRLGRVKSLMPWEPRAGRYQLELRDSKGRVIDRVLFEVRGRTFASAQ